RIGHAAHHKSSWVAGSTLRPPDAAGPIAARGIRWVVVVPSQVLDTGDRRYALQLCGTDLSVGLGPARTGEPRFEPEFGRGRTKHVGTARQSVHHESPSSVETVKQSQTVREGSRFCQPRPWELQRVQQCVQPDGETGTVADRAD